MKIEPLLAHLLCLKIHSRTLNIMKVAVFMMFFCVFQLLASNGKAQNAVIELSSNSVTVETLFAEIEKQTDYLVVYSSRELDVKSYRPSPDSLLEVTKVPLINAHSPSINP